MERTSSDRDNEKDTSSDRHRDGREESGPSKSEAGSVGSLHRTVGNQAVKRLYRTGNLQAKLAVSQPDDPAEREAERVADQVIRMKEMKPTSDPQEGIQVSRKPVSEESVVGDETEQRIESITTGGKPLSPSTRSFFEPRFGRDFSNVRVHTGAKADEAARSINAEAFTHDTDMVFRSGKYDPNSSVGKQLMAHELTHVVQQTEPANLQPSQQEQLRARTIQHGGVAKYVQRQKEETSYDDLIKDLAGALQQYYGAGVAGVENAETAFGLGGSGGTSLGDILIGGVIGAVGVAGAVAGGLEAAVAAAVLGGTATIASWTKDLIKYIASGNSMGLIEYLNAQRSEFKKWEDAFEKGMADAGQARSTLKSHPHLDFSPLLNENVDKKKARVEIDKLNKNLNSLGAKISKSWEQWIVSGWLAAPNKGDGHVYYEHYAPNWEYGEQPQIPGLQLPSRSRKAVDSAWGGGTKVTQLGIPVRVWLQHPRTFPSTRRQQRGPSIESRGPPGSGLTWSKLEKKPGKNWKVTAAGYEGQEYKQKVAEGYSERAPIPRVEELDLTGYF